ncbi:MAG TPA: hypothetical protein VJ180_13175 [Pyrinomonadaceae bacterium]|nr:hypothetical protein [Pyrinomonadaceae bacterium]
MEKSMVKRLIRQFAALTMASVLLGVVALAQDQTTAHNLTPGLTTGGLSTNQAAASLLSTLPEADSLIYINPQRILNEAAPKVMPEADLAKMRQQFNDLRQFAGVDPSRIDYLVLAMRFRKPAADLTFQPPEFLIVTSGDFSADSLLTMARLALQEKLSEEKYGSKMLMLTTIDEIAKQSEKTPFLKSFTQLGLVALNTNTIAAGNINYLKAAVDASEGRERINVETLNSLLRDKDALLSLAGSPWNSFAKSFGLMGTEINARANRCESKLGDVYAAISMEGSTFKLRGAMNADNPDTAKVINSLLLSLLQTAASGAGEDKSAQAALKMLNITPYDSEVRLEADIPHQMVADFIRNQMKPKTAEEAKKPSSKPVKKRRTKRR